VEDEGGLSEDRITEKLGLRQSTAARRTRGTHTCGAFHITGDLTATTEQDARS
jgi:hypothetical protein